MVPFVFVVWVPFVFVVLAPFVFVVLAPFVFVVFVAAVIDSLFAIVDKELASTVSVALGLVALWPLEGDTVALFFKLNSSIVALEVLFGTGSLISGAT